MALWQAEYIRALLRRRYPGLEVELLILKTSGDRILDQPLYQVGGKGLFVKEIEEALLDGRADFAVHSVKDMPSTLPEGLTLGVMPPRERPEDVLLSIHYAGLEELPAGSRVGTSSPRRQAQLLALRPDLRVVNLRGNVDTRLRKLHEGECEAAVMALAGLKRLGLHAPREQILSPSAFLPACGQGALGLEYLEKRSDIAELLAFLDHKPTRICVEAERAFLEALGGGCQAPIAAHASWRGIGVLRLEGLIASPSGEGLARDCLMGKATAPQRLGQALAANILGKN